MTSLGLPPPAYLDTWPELPADSPPGHPHLIDCAQPTASKAHHLADIVATVLYNWNPDALRAFLYLQKETFVFRIEQPKGSKQIDYLIARTENAVIFGGYKTHPSPESNTTSYFWHYHIRYTICRSGLWVPTYAIHHGFGGSLLGEPVVKDEGRYGAAARDARWVDAMAHQYGKTLFVDKVWLHMDGVRKSVIIE